MPIAESLYTLALRAAAPALPLLVTGEGKLARGLRGRDGVVERMEAWAAGHRDPARPLVWFHAPSVGEGLQARAVLGALRARRPDAQVAYTFFSPSAEAFARGVGADFADYLPLDVPADVARALDALRPTVLAFSKTDVWPNLTRAARQRDVCMALLSATLPESSSRLGGPARALLGPAYKRLDVVAAISVADSDRFGLLGVRRSRRRVMGDARFDQVRQRAAAVDRGSPLLAPLAGFDGLTLVAGSTWPADEACLLPAVRAARDAGHPLRLVLVPHEPTPEHLEGAEAALEAQGLAHVRLSAFRAAGGELPAALLVDRVGVLGELYAAADLAYVGGGFGTAGLHSVLEPAAFGIPVLFGPRHANAREAGELVARRGAFSASDAAHLRDRVLHLCADEEFRREVGRTAAVYVAENLGAAERGADVVEELLESAAARRAGEGPDA